VVSFEAMLDHCMIGLFPPADMSVDALINDVDAFDTLCIEHLLLTMSIRYTPKFLPTKRLEDQLEELHLYDSARLHAKHEE